jgi:hypothetical protein
MTQLLRTAPRQEIFAGAYYFSPGTHEHAPVSTTTNPTLARSRGG